VSKMEVDAPFSPLLPQEYDRRVLEKVPQDINYNKKREKVGLGHSVVFSPEISAPFPTFFPQGSSLLPPVSLHT